MDQKGLWFEKPKGTNRQKSQKATKIKRSKRSKGQRLFKDGQAYLWPLFKNSLFI
jgi:hypothetical protein